MPRQRAAAGVDPRVVVIMEDSDRAKPLIAHLVLLGARVEVWDASTLLLDSAGPAPDLQALYFCRTSPSARTRGRDWAAACTSRVLEWLESHGAHVVNGSRALALEVCKWRQTRELARVGIATPRTLLVGASPQHTMVAVKEVLSERAQLPAVKPREAMLEPWDAWWIKPTHGGSGAGTMRVEEMAAFARAAEKEPQVLRDVFRRAPDNLLIVQKEAARPPRGQRGQHTGRRARFLRTFYRAEFVGAELMYVLRVVAVNTAVSACPCDKKTTGDVTYEVMRDPWTSLTDAGVGPRARARAQWWRFCDACLAYMRNAGMAVGAFEFLVPRGGPPVVIDVNSNTNYGEGHERRAGVECGYRVLARELTRQAVQVASAQRA